MQRYAPNALELASRDVVSRSETTEIEAGRGVNGSVFLDLRHLGPEKILTKLPGSRELAMTYAGVDPIYTPIPFGPAPTTTWGDRDGQLGPDGDRRALRRRRGRVFVGRAPASVIASSRDPGRLVRSLLGAQVTQVEEDAELRRRSRSRLRPRHDVARGESSSARSGRSAA